MTQRRFWHMAGVLTVGLLLWPLSVSPAGEAERTAGLTGTVIAVVPSSRTLVVDVPLGKDVLRVGAEVTDQTKITQNGRAVPLDHLKAGDGVRIDIRRIPTGNEAISVEVLRRGSR